jgi:hypothetical protein
MEKMVAQLAQEFSSRVSDKVDPLGGRFPKEIKAANPFEAWQAQVAPKDPNALGNMFCLACAWELLPHRKGEEPVYSNFRQRLIDLRRRKSVKSTDYGKS